MLLNAHKCFCLLLTALLDCYKLIRPAKCDTVCSSDMNSFGHTPGRPSPPKPMMHIISYFHKIYKFSPISEKCYISTISAKFGFFGLIYVFLLPPIYKLCFRRTGQPWTHMCTYESN